MDTLKKFQKKFNAVKDEMSRWENIQSRFVSQFSSASSIILRLPVIGDTKNFVNLDDYENFPEKLVAKQMEYLQTTMVLMKETLDEFGSVVASFEKIVRDCRSLVEKESNPEQRIGFHSSLADCTKKLETLCDMHKLEYRLKSSLFEALWPLTFKPNAEDLSAVRQLLVDQPNIPREKVDDIFDYLVFPENP